MDKIVDHHLIRVTEEDRRKTRQNFNINDAERIRQGIAAVTEWCQKQDHFVENNINKNILERLFVLSKGSIEDTKKKIDRMFTTRGMMPELTLHRSLGEFTRLCECINYVPLPKINPVDQTRVMITQLLTEQLNEFTILLYFRYAFMITEYRYNFDYSLAERYIVDLKNFTLSILSKVNPMVVKKSEILCTEGFGTKIKGIHILNAPPFVDKLVFILKQALKEKVAKRLHVHNNYEDLHKHISKEVLPIDYDGDEQSVSKLQAQWKDELSTPEATEYIVGADRLVTDETRRNSAKFNEEYMGLPGSFRKLTVD